LTVATSAGIPLMTIGYEGRTPAGEHKQYRGTHGFAQPAADYPAHIAGQDAQVEDLYQMALAQTCRLLCCEREPERCHRSLLASVVAGRGGRKFKVCHI
jgi:uncharacterized protein YeaO (DUF488 family)